MEELEDEGWEKMKVKRFNTRRERWKKARGER